MATVKLKGLKNSNLFNFKYYLFYVYSIDYKTFQGDYYFYVIV